MIVSVQDTLCTLVVLTRYHGFKLGMDVCTCIPSVCAQCADWVSNCVCRPRKYFLTVELYQIRCAHSPLSWIQAWRDVCTCIPSVCAMRTGTLIVFAVQESTSYQLNCIRYVVHTRCAHSLSWIQAWRDVCTCIPSVCAMRNWVSNCVCRPRKYFLTVELYQIRCAHSSLSWIQAWRDVCTCIPSVWNNVFGVQVSGYV